jgi:hypothetical protein
MATIDTLALAERLEREYGDDPERARRHARILGDMAAASDVATKHDIKDLHSGIGQLRTEMHESEARLRIEIQSEGNKLRAELHREIAGVRTDMGNLAWKVAGLLVAQAAVIIALIRLLPGGTP